MKKVFTKDQEQEIINYYKVPNSINETSKHFNVGRKIVTRILLENNIELHSKEVLDKISLEKTHKTNLQRYGVENVFQANEVKEKIKQTNLQNYGVENQFKRKEFLHQIIKDKYAVDNISQADFCKRKVKQTNLEKYGTATYLTSEQLKQTMNDNFGVNYYTQTAEFRKKEYITKKNNKSFNTSKAEIKYKKYLEEKYGKDNVLTQYTDKRYPFTCDFYIKSKDLFIELNLHWTHGGKQFENSKEDQIKLATWIEKSKTSIYYKNAIKTWTIRDVAKINVAKQNNLNYIAIYKL